MFLAIVITEGTIWFKFSGGTWTKGYFFDSTLYYNTCFEFWNEKGGSTDELPKDYCSPFGCKCFALSLTELEWPEPSPEFPPTLSIIGAKIYWSDCATYELLTWTPFCDFKCKFALNWMFCFWELLAALGDVYEVEWTWSGDLSSTGEVSE